MADRTSHVILASGIKLDRNYKDVLNLSEAEILQIVNNHKVAEATNCSFIGGHGDSSIRVDIPYATCLKANYIAYRNPSYSNKWFFAFIDEVVYGGANKSVTINFTIDIWSTWWDYWQASTCFVEREHVSDDTPGLHTIPESFELGEFTCNGVVKDNTFGVSGDNLCYILASTTNWNTKVDPQSPAVKQDPNGGGRYNGIYSGCKYYRFDIYDQVTGRIGVKDALIQMADIGQVDNVVGIFIAPKFLAPYKENTTNNEVAEVLLPSTSGRIVGNNTNIDGYQPLNNKLLCYPFNFLKLTNGNGTHAIYQYELFKSGNQNGLQNANVVDFQVDGVLCPGCSGVISPRNYKGVAVNYDEAISLGKYPIASFQTDMYTNWLSQNSINLPQIMDGLNNRISVDDMSVGSSLIGLVASASAGSVGGTIGNLSSVASSIMSKQQHALIPPHTTGENVGDVVTSLGNNTPQYYKMSIRKEYAEIIDQFFNKYGYQINKVKVPTFSSRPNWNYIKIGAGEKIGFVKPLTDTSLPVQVSIPAETMDAISQICQNGVTVWHSHGAIGNFALNNQLT